MLLSVQRSCSTWCHEGAGGFAGEKTLQNRTATVTKEIENNNSRSSEYLSGILSGNEYTLHARATGRASKLAEILFEINNSSLKVSSI